MKYSNSFHRYSKRYGLDPYLLVSIAMQESGIVLDRIRMVKGYVYVDKKYVPMKIETDFCMMQIHYRNVENMDLDLKKLITNHDYCIEIGAKILAYFRRYENSEENWWTRYNTSNSIKRKIYEKLVNRYYELRP
jgi:soluble lytic murein transglycosylase-like protein